MNGLVLHLHRLVNEGFLGMRELRKQQGRVGGEKMQRGTSVGRPNKNEDRKTPTHLNTQPRSITACARAESDATQPSGSPSPWCSLRRGR